ncbi:MAG: pyridoxal phosphate-dependent aminotransferase [Treponemataceae bacterium]
MFSKRIAKLNPYVPGEQPKDKVYIKLNANENPYAPSPNVALSVKNFVSEYLQKMAFYPDPDSFELRKAIAKHLNETGGCMNSCRFQDAMQDKNTQEKSYFEFKISPEMIFCGNGSDEVLSFIFYTFFDSDKNLIIPAHTYSFYPVYCAYYDIPLAKVDLNKDFTIDTKKMLELAQKNCGGMIFANPNAPTALTLCKEQVREMLKNYPTDKVFVLDEAYADFSDESCLSLLFEFKNLVIIRTFSKSMCFAGMRLGYCVANPELIEKIFVVKNSFNHFPVDVIAQIAGISACSDTSYYVDITKKIVRTRNEFSKFLKQNSWNFLPSSTNFILASKCGFDGKFIYENIKNDGIIVRHFAEKRIGDFVRITIGTDQQMQLLQKSMEKLK